MLHHFDGIFHGDDVILARLVQFVDKAGKCGGFAAADWASYQNNPIVVIK